MGRRAKRVTREAEYVLRVCVQNPLRRCVAFVETKLVQHGGDVCKSLPEPVNCLGHALGFHVVLCTASQNSMSPFDDAQLKVGFPSGDLHDHAVALQQALDFGRAENTRLVHPDQPGHTIRTKPHPFQRFADFGASFGHQDSSGAKPCSDVHSM